MSTDNRRVAIYARVSSERQGADGRVSIGEQLADCRAYAAERGYTVAVELVDRDRYRGKAGRLVEPSAKRPDRPGWVTLLAGLGRDYETILAWRLDRLCRGSLTTGMLEQRLDETGGTVELAREQFSRKLMGLVGAIGGLELDTIRERMQMGTEGRVRAGQHAGDIPFGYQRIRDATGRSIGYEMLPEAAPFFAELARLFLARTPLTQIAAALGTNPATGRPWQHATIRFLISNPFYRGRLAYGRTVRPSERVIYAAGQHAPAWDAETCAAIERELERRQRLGRSGPRRSRHAYLFAGLLYCGYCGRVMARTRGGPGGRWPGYACGQPRYARLGQVDGPPHPANNISEGKVLRWLSRELGQTTAAEIDEYLAGLTTTASPAPAALLAERDQLAQRVAEFQAAEAALAAMPSAQAALRQDRERAATRLASLDAQLAALPAQLTTAHRDELRAHMLALTALADLAHLDRAEIAALIAAHCPPLQVRQGSITLA